MAQYCTLTAATCDPASTSASISARLLYCCGDSITISLLGALPARPCMVWSILRPSTRCETHCTHTAMAQSCPQCVKWESSVDRPVRFPLCSITIAQPPLSLSLYSRSVSHQKGRAPPTLTAVQLWGCVWICVCVCVCVCVCTYSMWFVRGEGEEKSTTPPLKYLEEAQRSCRHVPVPPAWCVCACVCVCVCEVQLKKF